MPAVSTEKAIKESPRNKGSGSGRGSEESGIHWQRLPFKIMRQLLVNADTKDHRGSCRASC